MQDLHHQYHSAKSPRPTWPQPFCVDPEASSKIGFHPETLCIYIYILCPKKENHEFLLISNRDTHMHRSLFSWYFFLKLLGKHLHLSHLSISLCFPCCSTFHLWICPTLAQLPHGHELTWSTSAPRARRVESRWSFAFQVWWFLREKMSKSFRCFCSERSLHKMIQQ